MSVSSNSFFKAYFYLLRELFLEIKKLSCLGHKITRISEESENDFIL